MEVTLFGMVMEVRPLQYRNAELPMEVTLLGIVIDVSPLQPWKAYALISVTPLGMVRSFISFPFKYK